jgi:D-xylose transport system ATP-binding protein
MAGQLAGGEARVSALVELRGVDKHFGGVHAVRDVTLRLASGEVVGLLGHNGAGKSTLMKLLSGAHAIDAGEIRIDGRPVSIRSPRDARALGIETLYQTLALADNLDTAANLFLGRELTTPLGTLDQRAMERAAAEVIGRLDPHFPSVREPVRRLSGGERQLVAIARAVHFDARVLIMDEPTAALGPEETARVAELIRRLSGEGLGIFLVSHDLHDVFDLADRVAVMRNGRLVGTRSTAETSREQVLGMIIAGSDAPGSRMEP